MKIKLGFFMCFLWGHAVLQASSPGLEDFIHEFPKFESTVMGMKIDDGKNIMDVHVYNRVMKPHSAFFNKCNQALLHENTYNHKIVLAQMLELRVLHKDLDLPDISKEVAQLDAYLHNHNFDGETGMHVTAMLNALWNYLHGPIDEIQRKTFIKVLYDKMRENTQQKGGCFPGYAGRLMQLNHFCLSDLYSTIIRDKLQELGIIGDEDIELGTALSLSQAQEETRLKEQDDLSSAMLASLENSKKDLASGGGQGGKE
ncbi:MAG: hypothetical protein KBB83_03530 [Alphaproteobacteria bacterium]|nr:hypothetical protein [Alphaproteobacteria bacterium]